MVKSMQEIAVLLYTFRNILFFCIYFFIPKTEKINVFADNCKMIYVLKQQY